MDDKNLAEEYADSLSATLDAIWDAIDAEGKYEGRDALEYLGEMPLEVVWEKGEPFAVVLTVGGPHAEITGGGRSSSYYTLTVHWGGDIATRSGTPGFKSQSAISRTGEYFRDLLYL